MMLTSMIDLPTLGAKNEREVRREWQVEFILERTRHPEPIRHRERSRNLHEAPTKRTRQRREAELPREFRPSTSLARRPSPAD